MNKAILYVFLILSLVASCNRVKKISPTYVVKYFQDAALLVQDSNNNSVIDLLSIAPDGANQVGFFPPYQLGLFADDKESQGLSKLSKLSKSRHLDQFWCLAFFKDYKLISFVDIPIGEVYLRISPDSLSYGLFYFSDLECNIIVKDTKIILQIFSNPNLESKYIRSQ